MSYTCNFKARHALGLAVMLVCALTAPLRALDPACAPTQYHYADWNMTDGLPYSAVRSVFQSSDGYLWFGTRAGLSRFDSVTFTNFSTKDTGGLPLDEVSFLAEDMHHRLWVGTRKGVLWYHDGIWSKPSLGAEIDNAEITGLLVDGNGMYIANTSSVLRWEDGRISKIELGAKNDLGWYFQALHRARNGDLLVMGSILVRIKKDGTREIFDNTTRIPNNPEIRSIAEDREGGLWLASKTGLYHLKDNQLQRFPGANGFKIEVVRSLFVDRDENLWIGTPNGLLRYTNGKIEAVTINGNEALSHILCIQEDIEGNLWCGTDSGVMRLHDTKITNLTTRDGLPINSINTICKTRSGEIWVGTNGGGGLVHAKPSGMQVYTTQDGLADNTPMVLSEASDGGLWIGYYANGLDHLNKDGKVDQHRTYNNIVSGIVELSPGDLWVSILNRGGLFHTKNGVTQKADAPLKEAMPRALAGDSKGRLWVAWDRGTAVLENEKWTRFDEPADRGPRNPVVFHEHTDGTMWLLRDDFELQRFTSNGIQRLKLPEALGRLGYGLIVRDGEAWLSMRNGILRAKVSDLIAVWEGRASTFDYIFYNESDGMRSPAPNNVSPSALADLGAQGIWVSTTKGIAVIKPERIRINNVVPNVVIESVMADRHKMLAAPTVQVPAGRGEIVFRYTALSLGDPNRVFFKYRLDGMDRDWIDAKRQREAYYGGLPPGTYTFRVIACNEDNLWNEQGATCKIVIAPHAYETWWFWFLAGVAILSSFGLFFWWRTRLLRKQQRLLMLEVDERTKDLKAARDAALAASKAKSEFVANMSHEIRTPMNGVIGLTELALSLSNNKEQSSYLKTVLASGDALMTVINDILDFSKIESGKLTLDLVEFSLADCVQHVIEPLALRAAQKQLELLCDFDASIPAMLVGDNDRLRQVLFNTLGNAIKFTEKGSVSLSIKPAGVITSTSCPLHICVSDTGIGIPKDRVEAIFQPFVQADSSMTRRYGGTGLGLTISRQLVTLMGGKIYAESQPGEGSQFHIELTLPVGSAATPAEPISLRLNGPVLVLDDHPLARKATEKLLLEQHVSTFTASTADEARNSIVAAKTELALLIVDEQLGTSSGYDAIDLIRKIPGCAKIPAILLLASDRPADHERCAALNIEHKLRKPVFRRQLLDILRTVSHNRKKHSTPPVPESGKIRALRVLLAEDTPVNQLVVRKMLEIGGHAVDVVSTGTAAIEHFKRTNYDLILMDVQMPELDGREASIRIRQLEAGSGKHTPIIALTAHAMQGDAELCLAAGMDDYLTKPLKRQELTRTLSRYFAIKTTSTKWPE
ncbi:MAG: response regulator [Nibricoccus sp.]